MAPTILPIPYGRDRVILELQAESSQILRCDAKPVCAPAEPASVLIEALEQPIGSAPLSELLKDFRRVLLVLSDPTRRLGYKYWLSALIDLIKRNLHSSSELVPIIASGTHKPFPRDVVLDFLGVHIDYVYHDCEDEDNLVCVGISSRGTQLTLNRRLLEADLIITTSSVTFHYFSGFTGGIKSVFPGLGGRGAIIQNHGLTLLKEQGAFHPACRPGNLVGNPVHEDFLEVVKYLPRIFSVNVVVDAEGKPLAFFAGDVIKSHLSACEFYKENFTCSFPKVPPLVILSAGGYPLDISLYQAHKALKSVEYALPPGSDIFFFAECEDGLGHPAFNEWRGASRESVTKRLYSGYEPLAHLILSLLTIVSKFRVHLISSLPDDETSMWGFTPEKMGSVQDSLNGLMRKKGEALFQPYGAEILVTTQ